MNAAEVVDEPQIQVSDYLSDWLAHIAGRVRPKTLEGYRALLVYHAVPHLGDLTLGELRPLMIQRLYAALLAEGLSAGTVLNFHLVLTQAFGQAQRWGLVLVNPVSGAQPPRPQRREPTVVDAPMATRLIELVRGTRLALPVVLALSTGMRRGEILGLRWSDVSGENAVVHVRRSLQVANGELVWAEPKTRRSRRSVELPAFAAPYLADARRNQARRREETQSWIDGLRRYEEFGIEGLRDRSRRLLMSPNATTGEVVGKIVYLRQTYHFGPEKISMYLKRYHDIQISCSGVWRILKRIRLRGRAGSPWLRRSPPAHLRL